MLNKAKNLKIRYFKLGKKLSFIIKFDFIKEKHNVS